MVLQRALLNNAPLSVLLRVLKKKLEINGGFRLSGGPKEVRYIKFFASVKYSAPDGVELKSSKMETFRASIISWMDAAEFVLSETRTIQGVKLLSTLTSNSPQGRKGRKNNGQIFASRTH